MDYLNTQAQIRPCGSSWEYCDGICDGCFKRKISSTSTTYPSYGEDLDSLFHEAEIGGK